MAERSVPPPLWALFEQLDAELPLAIVALLSNAGRSSLRLACSSARALLNSRVARIELPAEEVIGRPLRRHERFTRLEALALLADGPALTSDSFADFAIGELERLASLAELHLRDSKSLGTAAVAVLQQCCPQLRILSLAGTGGCSADGHSCTCCAVTYLTAVTYESNPRAVLTSITCPRSRGKPHGAAAAGLPHPPDAAGPQPHGRVGRPGAADQPQGPGQARRGRLRGCHGPAPAAPQRPHWPHQAERQCHRRAAGQQPGGPRQPEEPQHSSLQQRWRMWCC
jgi:hypothetical protein